jgi:hypothetical protein
MLARWKAFRELILNAPYKQPVENAGVAFFNLAKLGAQRFAGRSPSTFSMSCYALIKKTAKS